MQQARVTIIEPNGVRRTMPLNPQGMLIGRDPECEIVLGYDRASRHHAQISFDGEFFYVTDLNSRNGTFLGKNQLAPDTPAQWPPDLPVRIGGIYLRLEIPNYLEYQEKEQGAKATVSGEIPIFTEENQGGSSRVIIFALVGLGLLCACVAAGGAAYLFLS